ncbi:glycine cleavage system protein GcvH [Thermosulfurimonas dismutans]|uniref:Glycine cleavage system H protein n=1 Tax=Thermosulfurimonas dismutans TaxID=999894 RepID=A0A179D834_9BACT|nr:glycine cleavage system protein GcvH [Thermosulfurimonas dismutans]OAQ21748.1 Glycine cleavage system H protein [Thermosulfurimonas dismutans]
MAIPEDRFYSEEHLWVKKERGNRASIGLSAFAQRLYGEILDLELPEEGDELIKGEIFGSVESARGVEELVAPVSGEVVEVNEEILEDPEIVNGDPYGDGWLIKVKLSDLDELEELMAADEYEDFLEEQGEIPTEEEEEFFFEEEE